MPSSASFVVEFIKSRPAVEREVRKLLDHPYRAPEVMVTTVADYINNVMAEKVTDEERTNLDRMRGNGNVDWKEVSLAFKTRPQRCFYCDAPKIDWDSTGGMIDCLEGRDVHEWRYEDDPFKPIEVKS